MLCGKALLAAVPPLRSTGAAPLPRTSLANFGHTEGSSTARVKLAAGSVRSSPSGTPQSTARGPSPCSQTLAFRPPFSRNAAATGGRPSAPLPGRKGAAGVPGGSRSTATLCLPPRGSCAQLPPFAPGLASPPPHRCSPCAAAAAPSPRETPAAIPRPPPPWPPPRGRAGRAASEGGREGARLRPALGSPGAPPPAPRRPAPPRPLPLSRAGRRRGERGREPCLTERE